MMLNEWTTLTGNNPTPEQWDVIETVYTWHRSITDAGGKKQMKALYDIGGYPIIASLYTDAVIARDLESERRQLNMAHNDALADLQAQIGRLSILITEENNRYAESLLALERRTFDIENGIK